MKREVNKKDRTLSYEADIRYHGQGLLLTVNFDIKDLRKKGFDVIGNSFDEMHKQLFTFALDADKELVNLRAVAQGKSADISAEGCQRVTGTIKASQIRTSKVYMDGKDQVATLYDRSKLKSESGRRTGCSSQNGFHRHLVRARR